MDPLVSAAPTAVVTARQGDDRQARQDLGDWQRRPRRLRAADPHLDEEPAPLLPAAEQSHIRDITMTATASGHGRVFPAGRDQHINER